MEQKRGFFGQLFDFSFTEFITTKAIKVLYGLAIFGAHLDRFNLLTARTLPSRALIPVELSHFSASRKFNSLICRGHGHRERTLG